MPEFCDVQDPWVQAMRRGDFESAWRISDAVLLRRRMSGTDCSAWPRHLQFVWRGDSFDRRRVLVRCYHGLGDTIQFVRLIARLRARAAHVSLWVQPALVDLLRSAAGIDELLPLHDGTPEVRYDVDLELMELPHALRVTSRDLPGPVPYLDAPRTGRTVHDRTGRSARVLQVGLVWRSGDWDPRRHIDAALLAPLQEVPKVRWYSLQYPAESLPFTVANLGCADIVRMAARMRSLDAIVSVDTMTAHLAGALGLEVFTLIPEPSDWRWADREGYSVWYPTMRLLRQPAAGAWPPVIERLAALLAARAESAFSFAALDMQVQVNRSFSITGAERTKG